MQSDFFSFVIAVFSSWNNIASMGDKSNGILHLTYREIANQNGSRGLSFIPLICSRCRASSLFFIFFLFFALRDCACYRRAPLSPRADKIPRWDQMRRYIKKKQIATRSGDIFLRRILFSRCSVSFSFWRACIYDIVAVIELYICTPLFVPLS